MFRNFEIKNYRGIRHLKIENLGSINIFYGKNNCGKSSVLEAAFLISGPNNSILPYRINSMRRFDISKNDDIDIIFYNRDTAVPIQIKADEERARTLTIELKKFKSKSAPLVEGAKDSSSDMEEERVGLIHKFKIDGNSQEFESISILDNDKKEIKLDNDKAYKESRISKFLSNHYFQGDDNTFKELANIIENRAESDLLDILKVIEPKIRSIQLVNKNIMVDVGINKLLPISMMGDGLVKLLYIIMSIYNVREGRLMIDEIENGFHHDTMTLLWRAIFHTIKKYGTQLFISSHSSDILQTLTNVLGNEEFSSFRNDVSVYKLVKDRNDEVTALRYTSESIKYAIEQEIDIR